MEEKNVKKGSVAIGIILCLIAIFLILIVFGIYYLNNQKKALEAKIDELEQIIVEKDKEINELKHEESSDNDEIYGYLNIYKDNEKISEVYELHTNSNNKKLFDCKGHIYSFTLKHNKLYCLTQESISSTYIEKTFYLDLSDQENKLVELTNIVDVESFFDNSEEYLFSAFQTKGIKKYDMNNKTEKILMEDKGAYELYIKDSLIYVTAYAKPETVPVEEYYYTIDFEGENFKEITKSEYEKSSKLIQYSKPISEYENMYYILKNKKVSLKEDCSQILYDNNVIYSANNGRKIRLCFTDSYGKIAFEEYEGTLDVHDVKYYLYDIETQKLNEVKENEIYEMSIIIKQ